MVFVCFIFYFIFWDLQLTTNQSNIGVISREPGYIIIQAIRSTWQTDLKQSTNKKKATVAWKSFIEVGYKVPLEPALACMLQE